MTDHQPSRPFQVLFLDDGSPDAIAAAELIRDLVLSAYTQVTVLGLVAPHEAAESAFRLAQMDQTRALLEQFGLPVTTDLVGGNPVEKISQYAQQVQPDLIAMGTTGSRAGLGIQVGVIAQQVLETAHWPLVLSKAPYAGLERILVVSDGSFASQRALDYLAQFPLPTGLDVRLVTILPFNVDKPGDGQEPDTARLQESNLRQSEAESKAREALEQAEETLSASRLQVKGELLRGDPAEQVIEYIQSQDIHLLVAGAHGLTAIPEWLFEQVAPQLIRDSSCSVLIVRSGPL